MRIIYDRIPVLPLFKQKFKQSAIEKGYPTMIAYQRALLEEDEPFNNIIKTKKRGKNDFYI